MDHLKGYSTPKMSSHNKKLDGLSFTTVGNSIMRKTDYNSISNKKVFSLSGGLGAYTIGSDDWRRGKEK
jgi:hypothetical protein